MRNSERGDYRLNQDCYGTIHSIYKFIRLLILAGLTNRNNHNRNGQCGFGGQYLQKSWHLKGGARHLAPLQADQNFYLIACKGGKSNVIFSNPEDTSSKYTCKN